MNFYPADLLSGIFRSFCKNESLDDISMLLYYYGQYATKSPILQELFSSFCCTRIMFALK